MTAGNAVGVDPHRETFTATILDEHGGEVDHALVTNARAGHADAERLGCVARADRTLVSRARVDSAVTSPSSSSRATLRNATLIEPLAPTADHPIPIATRGSAESHGHHACRYAPSMKRGQC